MLRLIFNELTHLTKALDWQVEIQIRTSKSRYLNSLAACCVRYTRHNKKMGLKYSVQYIGDKHPNPEVLVQYMLRLSDELV